MKLQAVIFEGVARRREAIEDARLAGRLGATRLPDSVLMATGDPSDSMIIERLDALEAGRAEREQLRALPLLAAPISSPAAYFVWLTDDMDRLTRECMESGCDDGGVWLRQKFTLETGEMP